LDLDKQKSCLPAFPTSGHGSTDSHPATHPPGALHPLASYMGPYIQPYFFPEVQTTETGSTAFYSPTYTPPQQPGAYLQPDQRTHCLPPVQTTEPGSTTGSPASHSATNTPPQQPGDYLHSDHRTHCLPPVQTTEPGSTTGSPASHSATYTTLPQPGGHLHPDTQTHCLSAVQTTAPGVSRLPSAPKPTTRYRHRPVPSGDKKLMQRWQDLQNINIPEFIKELSPEWIPGKFLSDEALFQLFTDEHFHTKFVNWAKEELSEMDSFLGDHFEPVKILQPYDSQEAAAHIIKGRASFERLLSENKRAQTANTSPLPTVLPEDIYKITSDDTILAARFNAHLILTHAQRKITYLSKITIQQYMNHMFGNGSTSFKLFFKNWFGTGRSIGDMMLSYTNPTIPFDTGDADRFITPNGDLNGDKMNSSACNQRAASLKAFIKFLLTAANKAEFDPKDTGASGIHLKYTNR